MRDSVLVTLANEKYIDQVKQVFSGAYFNAGWRGDYLLLAHEIPEEKLGWFRDRGIFVKECEPLSSAGFCKWPPVVFSKLYLFAPRFKQWKNIVYLDADIIVRASLEELTKIDGIGAIADKKLGKLFLPYWFIYFSGVGKNEFKRLKKTYNLSEQSFSSGVIAFSSNIIQGNTFSKLKELLEFYGPVSNSTEEAIINLFFYKKISPISETYSVFPSYNSTLINIPYSQIKGAAIHDSLVRPWSKESYFYNEWRDNLARADFINTDKPEQGKKWSEEDAKNYFGYLGALRKKFFYKFVAWNIKNSAIKNAGLLGILTKYKYPRIYRLLKNVRALFGRLLP